MSKFLSDHESVIGIGLLVLIITVGGWISHLSDDSAMSLKRVKKTCPIMTYVIDPETPVVNGNVYYCGDYFVVVPVAP